MTRLANVTLRVETWAESMPHITDEETRNLLDTIEKAKLWITTKMEEQSKTSPFETPVFDSSEVEPQLKPVSILFEKLVKKPR